MTGMLILVVLLVVFLVSLRWSARDVARTSDQGTASTPRSPASPRLSDALVKAATDSDAKEIERLLTQGAPVDAKGKYDQTALHRAAGSGNCAAIEVLPQHGAQVNARDSAGNFTPLHILLLPPTRATRPAVDMLVSAGADVNAKSNHGVTPPSPCGRVLTRGGN